MNITRRQFAQGAAGAVTTAITAPELAWSSDSKFRLNYILGSPMYGTTSLRDVIAEAHDIGASYIDVWPAPHANHREQMDELGHDQVVNLLAENEVKLGMLTRYDLGPFALAAEMQVLKRFGGSLLVCGAKNVGGSSSKQRIEKFVEALKPHVATAAEHGVKIGIENHNGSIISSPDSIRHFADIIRTAKLSPHLGLAMAPYHLPQNAKLIANLITALGDECLAFFQAWQHGKGCMKKLPKEDELLQLPGRGSLDFAPVLTALRKINYSGWTEIFMHPVPRGIPIMNTTSEVTREINRSREYLAQCLSTAEVK